MKSETVEYKGMTFRRYPDADRRSDRVYFKKTVRGKPCYLHRMVYEDANGPIPKGMHIHHIDGDEGNNDISNLEMLTPSDHINEHMDDERREWCINNLAVNARPKASAWHKDPANRQHHVEIGGMAYKNFSPEDKACEQCRKMFKPKKLGSLDRFCSNSCKSAHRRDSGVDDIERECGFCMCKLTANKYSKTRFCSKSCKMKNQWSKK